MHYKLLTVNLAPLASAGNREIDETLTERTSIDPVHLFTAKSSPA